VAPLAKVGLVGVAQFGPGATRTAVVLQLQSGRAGFC